MTRGFRSGIVVIGLYLCMCATGYAQLRDNIELNVFGGGSWYTSKDFVIQFPQSTIPVQGEFRLNRAIRYGARLGVYTHGHWSEEFFYSYEPNSMHLIRNTPPTSSLNLSMQVHNYGITALYYFNDDETHTIRPFVDIGVGGTLFRPTPAALQFAHSPLGGDIPTMKSSNEISMNYGVGVKTRVNNWLGFRADVKGYLSATPSFGLPHQSNDPTVTVLPLTGAFSNAEASAGLVFYFFNRR